MISKQLEAALGEALREARRRRHEYLCAEHVLYALLDDDYGRRILESCGARVENLRRKLNDFLEQEVSPVPEGQELIVQQTVSASVPVISVARRRVRSAPPG